MDSNNTLYCRLASNGYSKTTLNTKGLTNVRFPMLTNNYYSIYMNGNNYFALNGSSTNARLAYKIDIDNCQIISNSYLKLSFMENIPLAKEGLGWILPAIIFGIIGFLIKSKRVRSKV